MHWGWGEWGTDILQGCFVAREASALQPGSFRGAQWPVFHHVLLKVPSLVVLRCSQMTCLLFPFLQTQLFLWMLPTVPSLLGQEWDLSTPPGHLVCDENPPSSLGHCYPWAFCLGRRQTGPLTPTMLGLAPAKSYVAPYNMAPVLFQKTIQSAQAANISQARPLG